MLRNKLILTIIYIVAVYATTIVLQIYQPATGGYFNLGEAVIYVAAILHGPLVAGLAGGIGASLADLSTGYGIFAPGTLVIKFIEGYVAGTLIHKYMPRREISVRKGEAYIFAGSIGGAYTALVAVFATIYWSGKISLGPMEYPLKIPLPLWILIAFILGGAITYTIARRMGASWEAVSILVAGSLMVIGYLLYEYYISNPLTGRPPFTAVFEIPVNIGQVAIGAAIALPTAGWLKRAGYIGGKTVKG